MAEGPISILRSDPFVLGAKPEKGKSVNIGTPKTPFILDQSQLKEVAKKMGAQTSKKNKWKEISTTILAVVLLLFGAGVAKTK
jgi:hypothetical protein